MARQGGEKALRPMIFGGGGKRRSGRYQLS
jgi:hypothetical protein